MELMISCEYERHFFFFSEIHLKYVNGLLSIIRQEIIDEQIRTFDENHERSFLDLYIREMKEAEKKQENTTFFCTSNYMECINI